MSLPLPLTIRFEVEHLKATVTHILMQHQEAMSEEMKKAVENACTPENLKRVIDDAAKRALEEAIRQEVSAFFSYGEGRKAVAAAVKESILKNETYTVLDTVGR